MVSFKVRARKWEWKSRHGYNRERITHEPGGEEEIATWKWELFWDISKAYILKGGICGHRIPQTIWNFRRKIVWERKKYQDYTVCRANWRSFPLLMLSHCNKLSIKTLKHTIFSMKIPHWHQILVIFMIYALLSQNFVVAIYALFPQNFGDWKSGFRRLSRF